MGEYKDKIIVRFAEVAYETSMEFMWLQKSVLIFCLLIYENLKKKKSMKTSLGKSLRQCSGLALRLLLEILSLQEQASDTQCILNCCLWSDNSDGPQEV